MTNQHSIILHLDAPIRAIDIAKDLKTQGLMQGTDFDFSFHPAKYDNDGWAEVTPKHTTFTFYDEKWATWFAIKWNDHKFV